jgi:hypothetical protein
MPSVHEKMHQRTEQQDEIWQSPHDMGFMLGPQEEPANDYQKDQGDVLRAQELFAVVTFCHNSSPWTSNNIYQHAT